MIKRQKDYLFGEKTKHFCCFWKNYMFLVIAENWLTMDRLIGFIW